MRKQKAFTLIELLVVISIIGLLSSVVLVSMKGTREKAKTASGQEFSSQVHHALGSEAVGIWNFDEGTGASTTDWSGYNNHGSLIGGTAWATDTPSGEKYALRFDGINDYIDLPNSLGYTTQVSAFAWFKSKGSPAGGYHIIFGGQELEISIPAASGAIRTGVFTSARYVSDHGSGLLDGNWHFIGFTFGSSVKKSYIDGVFVGEQTGIPGTLVSSFGSRRIGRFGSSGSYYTNGLIDEPRIYDAVLTAGEIEQYYAKGLRDRLAGF